MGVTIGIIALLLAAMFLIIKYFKKKVKIFFSVIIILLTCYFIILSVDINRVDSLKKPVFAIENGYMGSMIRYDGLGYRIGLEKDENGAIQQSQMSMFGKIISAAVS